MMRFQEDIDRINQMVDELESDLERTTRRVELCVDQLDDLAGRIAKASKMLREEIALQRLNVASGSSHALQ